MEEPEDGFTNKYGPLTKTAIRLFQMKNFSDYNAWDGIIGNDTYSLLMSDDAISYYLQRGDGDDRTKIITKLVDDVTALQQRLIELGYLAAGSDTGLYGNTTVLAVQKFQEYHGLDPIDGIAGQETLALINSSEAMDAVTGEANNKTKLNITPDASASAETTETTPAP
jgi:peptidoglycan hydrolase-like protein with peptidoglycan-binding domain